MLQKRRLQKTIVILFLTLLIVSNPLGDWTKQLSYAEENSFATEAVNNADLEAYIIDIINWKKAEKNQTTDTLLTNAFLENAGETSADWYVLGLGRAGIEDDYAAYLAVIKDKVQKRYQREEKLSAAKATEWHRISLTILAAGGDPTNVGMDEHDEIIDLIADGTYNRGKTSRPLGTQGINGWIWGLITLDSLRYDIPNNAIETRESIITEILRAQLEDGGFSLNTYETDSNVDLTAMALQALAPYYNSEETYTYKQISTNKEVTKKVGDVIDESLQLLSDLQLADGDYDLTGISNVESTAQVIVALTALGIDPLEDDRFIKNGNTLLDAILKYQMPDGGFLHSDILDAENKFADPNESNSMASEQVLYTLIALYRFYDEKRSLYDFREEMTGESKAKVTEVMEAIELIPNQPKSSDKNQIETVFASYLEVPIVERSYVYNYARLANAMEYVKLENTSEFIAAHMGENEHGNGNNMALFQQTEMQSLDQPFTNEDKLRVDELLEEATSTEYYVEVVTLIDKIHHHDTAEEHGEVLSDLDYLKELMEGQKEEIERLNQEILNKLYPFNNVTSDDEAVVAEVMNRYEALTLYDQEKIQGYEDVEKAATQIDNLIRAKYIKIGVAIIIVSMTILLVARYKKRKRAKMKRKMMDMDE